MILKGDITHSKYFYFWYFNYYFDANTSQFMLLYTSTALHFRRQYCTFYFTALISQLLLVRYRLVDHSKYKSMIKYTLTDIYRIRYPAAGHQVIQMISTFTNCDQTHQ